VRQVLGNRHHGLVLVPGVRKKGKKMKLLIG
jgi:hypothetical protein